MFNRPKFDRQKPGKPISARIINAPLDAIEAGLNLSVVAPLESTTTPAGVQIGLNQAVPLYAMITGGTNPYAWTEQYTDTGGTWMTGYQSGTTTLDPAYEINGNLTVPPGTIVWMNRAPASGQWLFQLAVCP
jgi:hypothetical protein